MTTHVYFIASALTKEVKAFNGSVITTAGETAWIGESEGYASWSSARPRAKRFSSAEEARAYALKNDGMPWYYRLEPGTLEVFKVTHTRIENVEEERVA